MEKFSKIYDCIFKMYLLVNNERAQTLRKSRLTREIYMSSAIFNAPMYEHKNPHKEFERGLSTSTASF